ncbi:hypothetical protein OS493_010634 [Desmophyllum pertusum]|uniref:Secreted protein n=1 Tax=Desmophyllum pertusum TaxID=174260 RepID=A0A9W9ZR52_9CNID|nr:hypothetical protein OS493_010634 [Desmophyllum pertusum]
MHRFSEILGKGLLWCYCVALELPGPVKYQSKDVPRGTPTQQEDQEGNAKGGAPVRHPKRRQKLPPRFRQKKS